MERGARTRTREVLIADGHEDASLKVSRLILILQRAPEALLKDRPIEYVENKQNWPTVRRNMTNLDTMPCLDQSETTERQSSEHKGEKEYRDDLMYVFGHRNDRKDTLSLDLAAFVFAFIKPIWDVMVSIWSMDNEEDALATRFISRTDEDMAQEGHQEICTEAATRRDCTLPASGEE